VVDGLDDLQLVDGGDGLAAGLRPVGEGEGVLTGDEVRAHGDGRLSGLQRDAFAGDDDMGVAIVLPARLAGSVPSVAASRRAGRPAPSAV
jgi:hypothetical protein